MVLNSHLIPGEAKKPEAWPEGMQQQWANELEHAQEHQQRHREAFRVIRETIDEFRPDAVIIFGDDQCENFKEDIIPPFNVYCMDGYESAPFAMLGALGSGASIWNEPTDYMYEVPGDCMLARDLAHGIISLDCPVAYSYRFLNQQTLTHAFANAMVFLDWQKSGWNYPIIPIAVNCYGTGVIHTRGGMAQLFDTRPESERDPFLDTPAPAGPTPRSCFALGRALRSVLEEKEGRYVIMASSGWSHASLTAKHHWLYPDRNFDRQRLSELQASRHNLWENLSNDAVEETGSQELKNWICLAGAFEDRRAETIDYLDTWIFNSQKCFALLPP